MIKTATTIEGVNAINFGNTADRYYWCKNIGETTLYVSAKEDISPDTDDVAMLESGDIVMIETYNQDIYVLGAGKIQIYESETNDCPFKVSGKGGEIPDLSAYAKKADIRNENLLINPDFKINQRGNIDFRVDYHAESPIPQSQKYTVDRWRIMDGTANISNGKFVLNGTIIQVLENSIGGDFTATVSVESGTTTASYDDSTKTFSIVGNNAVLNWAKLEYGSNATQFFPPDTATELMKCKRFYRTLNRGTLAYSSSSESVVFVETFDMPMRVNPDVKIVSSVVLTYCNGWIDEPNVSDMTIVSSNITKMGVCYLQVGGFNMTVNGTAFAENSSFRAATDNFIGLDAEIY